MEDVRNPRTREKVCKMCSLGIFDLGSFEVLSDHGEIIEDDVVVDESSEESTGTMPSLPLVSWFKETRISRYAEMRSGKLGNTLQWQRVPRRRRVLFLRLLGCSLLQNPNTSVLRGRLVSYCGSLPSNLYLHVLCYHSSTVLPGGSLPVVVRRFQLLLQKCQNKLRCWSMTRMRSLPYDRNQLFLYAVLKVSLEWSRKGKQHAAIQYTNTRCSSHARCAFSKVIKKNRSSPTASMNTKELGERLTIGPVGSGCDSHAPQLCSAATRTNLRLAPPRRSTRTNVRFDGSSMFSCILAICLRTCSESDSDFSVSSSWSASGSSLSVGFSPSSSP